MYDLIIAIILIFIGLVFISLGIRQIIINKKPNKYNNHLICEPIQIGILLIAIGLILFWLAAIFLTNYFLPEPNPYQPSTIIEKDFYTELLGLGLVLGISVFIVCISVYGLQNHRIFGIKTTAKITKSYIPINLFMLFCALIIIVLDFYHFLH